MNRKPNTTHGWKERDLEAWLEANPEIPGDQLLFVRRQKHFSRVVDLFFLDSRARLVLVEIKNERSTRTAVAQAVEYRR